MAEARRFLGAVVQAAIDHAVAVDFVNRSAWPVDVVELTRDGLTERRYKSLEDLDAPIAG